MLCLAAAGHSEHAFKFVPSLASIDAATSELPFFKELRDEYRQLQLTRQCVADQYAVLDKAQYYSFDGTVKSKFHPKGLPPATALPDSVSSFVDASSSTYKVPAQRTLSKICHHDAWLRLFADCRATDVANDAAGNTFFFDRECSRLISCSADHSGDWLDVLPTSERLQSDKFTVALQRRLGLYISAGDAYFDACEADGWAVGESDRLGDGLAHAANHSTAHKWICSAWRDAEAAASVGSVYLGDKKLGLLHYSQFNATYIPDIINVSGGDDGRPYLDEIKNYSCFVTKNTACPSVATLNGGEYAFGNTEEPLKWRVLGTRARGVPAMGPFDHTNQRRRLRRPSPRRLLGRHRQPQGRGAPPGPRGDARRHVSLRGAPPPPLEPCRRR